VVDRLSGFDFPISETFKVKYGPKLYNGLPYTGKTYDIKEDDPEYRKPVQISRVFIKQFETGNEEHMKEWSAIMQRVADGVSRISFEEKVYDEKIKGWRVLVRWMDDYYTNPTGVDI